ncbi:MAG: hypothetical protein A3K19_19430 [Lentisphaerae bacterium RIFOXYB12_FULL_65_16]|nr:MAG: hypothetical protein A3K18_31385 [Lentisphaerae bacterium RIFOXYA12_64_32]OGV92034.1 MAG: hypothetical protein A3K19_19430 [Lentisphaerae bacterium RIFOXYB12_FULL_65_16]
MKDPFHRDLTAYDVLGIAADTKPEAIAAAVSAAIGRGVPWDIVRAAKASLEDPGARGLLDFFYYDDAILRRLDPNPLETPAALAVPNRAETAARWTAQLRAGFPAPGLAHTVGLLWYWWAVHQEWRLMSMWRQIAIKDGVPEMPLSPRDLLLQLATIEGRDCKPGTDTCRFERCPWQRDCIHSAPPVREMWWNSIGCWGHVLATEGFWMDRCSVNRAQARRLCTQAQDHLFAWFRAPAQRFADPGFWLGTNTDGSAAQGASAAAPPSGETGVAEPPFAVPAAALAELEALYASVGEAADREFTLALDMTAAGLALNGHRVSCGKLLLSQLGLLERVRSAVEAEFRRHPESLPLSRVRTRLSPYGTIAALVDNGRGQEAMEALAALPPTEQQTPEIRGLRAKARSVLACASLRDGEWQQGLKACEEALADSPTDDTRRQIATEIVGVCTDCAQAMSVSSLDSAIQFLRRAARVVPGPAIELALGRFLAQRGLRRLGQIEADIRQGGMPPGKQTTDVLEESIADLQEAVRVGFTEYQEHVARGRRLLREAELGFLGLPRKMQQMLGNAYIAMEKGNWDRAVDLLRKVLAKLSKPSADPVRRHLAEVLSRRGEKRAEQGIRLLGLRDDLSRFFAIAPDDSRREAMVELELALADFAEATGIDPRHEERLCRARGRIAEVLNRERQELAQAPLGVSPVLPKLPEGTGISAWFRVSSVFCFLVIVLAIVGSGGWGYLIAVLPFLLLVFVFFLFFVK